jgi:transcriptional regulator with XRE-family HTH domain
LGRGIPHSEGGTRKTTVLGRAVREARLKQGYLQTRLAERVGITRQALSRIELGMNRPSQRVFAALEEILGKRLPSKNSDTTATNTNN